MRNKYKLFNCQGEYFGDWKTSKDIAIFTKEKHKSVQNAIAQMVSLNGWCILRNADVPDTMKGIIEECRRMDNRWAASDKDKLSVKYFKFKKQAIEHFGEDCIVCRARDAEEIFTEKSLYNAEYATFNKKSFAY